MRQRPTELQGIDERIAQELEDGHIRDVTFDEWHAASDSAYFNKGGGDLGGFWSGNKVIHGVGGYVEVIRRLGYPIASLGKNVAGLAPGLSTKEQRKVVAFGQAAAALVMALRREDQDTHRESFFMDDPGLKEAVGGEFEFEYEDGTNKYRQLLPDAERRLDGLDHSGLSEEEYWAQSAAKRYGGKMAISFLDFRATIKKYKDMGIGDIYERLKLVEDAFMANPRSMSHQAVIDAAAEAMEGCHCASASTDMSVALDRIMPLKK